MAHINWQDLLGWNQTAIDDLRSVAYSYVQQGIYDVALTFFETLVTIDPLKPYDLQMIGAIHLQLGNGLKALDYLDRALKLDPHHVTTQLNRARTLFILGYKRQGIAQATELEKSPNKTISEEAKALLLAYAPSIQQK